MPFDVKELLPENNYNSPYQDNDEFNEMLYARHVEIESLEDLTQQRGTPIPALFNQFYKFVQNPSGVSVETFKRMVDTDDTIGSGVDFLTTCLSARLGRYIHPNPEITTHVNKSLAAVEGGFPKVLKMMLSASWAGFFVGEKVYENNLELGFIPKKIAPLPPSTVLFETERTGEITPDGILQYQRNFNPYLLGRGVGYFGGTVSVGLGFAQSNNDRPDVFAKLGDLPFPLRTANSFNYLSIRIPKQKCIHYAFDAQGQFDNPYGRSLLRRIYKYYVIKDAILQMMSVALDRKGTALTIVYYDPNAPIYDPSKVSQGQQVAGNPKAAIHPGEAAKQSFRNIHNDSVIYLPGKKDDIFGVDFMPQSPNTADFIQALDFCNKSQLRGLLIPALLFGDGSGGYALGEVHQKTFEKTLDGINAGLEDVLLKQWVHDILVLNFPKKLWQKDGLGSFSKREMTQDEVQKVMEVYDKGITAGIIDQSDINDLNKMRDSIGFEERDRPIQKQGFDFSDKSEEEDTEELSGRNPRIRLAAVAPMSVAQRLAPQFKPIDIFGKVFVDNKEFIGGTIRYGSKNESQKPIGSDNQNGHEEFSFGTLTFLIDEAKKICAGKVNAEIIVDPVWSERINIDIAAAMRSTSENPLLVAQIPTSTGLIPMLIDGHHRHHKALMSGEKILPAYLLTAEETLQVMHATPDMIETLNKNAMGLNLPNRG